MAQASVEIGSLGSEKTHFVAKKPPIATDPLVSPETTMPLAATAL